MANSVQYSFSEKFQNLKVPELVYLARIKHWKKQDFSPPIYEHFMTCFFLQLSNLKQYASYQGLNPDKLQYIMFLIRLPDSKRTVYIC